LLSLAGNFLRKLNALLSLAGNLYLCIKFMGLTGFDSKMNGYVSMPSKAIYLVKLKCKQLSGENNYALAA
jgi:hypothetical protein